MLTTFQHCRYDPLSGKITCSNISILCWITDIPTSRPPFGGKEDAVKFPTMHGGERMEFPLAEIPGVGQMDIDETHTQNDTGLLYIAMTGSTNRLLVLGT